MIVYISVIAFIHRSTGPRCSERFLELGEPLPSPFVPSGPRRWVHKTQASEGSGGRGTRGIRGTSRGTRGTRRGTKDEGRWWCVQPTPKTCVGRCFLTHGRRLFRRKVPLTDLTRHHPASDVLHWKRPGQESGGSKKDKNTWVAEWCWKMFFLAFWCFVVDGSM